MIMQKCITNAKTSRHFFPVRVNFCIGITRRYFSAARIVKRCKTWKIQRVKDYLQQNPVIDVANVHFLSTEEKCFPDVNKEGNDKLSKLESTNSEK